MAHGARLPSAEKGQQAHISHPVRRPSQARVLRRIDQRRRSHDRSHPNGRKSATRSGSTRHNSGVERCAPRDQLDLVRRRTSARRRLPRRAACGASHSVTGVEGLLRTPVSERAGVRSGCGGGWSDLFVSAVDSTAARHGITTSSSED
jgi:hypothetical protein